MENKNITFFVGSGLSKSLTSFIGSGSSKSSISIPIGDNFLEKVLSEDRNKWVFDVFLSKKEETKIIGDIKKAEFFMSYLYLKDILERKDNGKFKENATKDYKKAIINFRMAMNDFLFSQKQVNLKYKEMVNNCVNKCIDKFENVNIITTNYDLLLDDIVGRDKLSYCLENGNDGKIKLIKLHGSINWLEERKYDRDEKELIGVKDYKEGKFCNHIFENLEKYRIVDEISKKYYSSNNEKLELDKSKYVYYQINENRKYTPITIPFFYQKYDWYSQRWGDLFEKRIWEEAKDILARSHAIIFIGYGFSDADFSILCLLNEAEWWKKKILNIGRCCDDFYKVGVRVDCCSGKYLDDFEDKEDLYRCIDCFINEKLKS